MEDHLPDEDVLALPDAWRRSLHARRGGAPGPKIKKVDASAPGAVRRFVEETTGAVDALLEGGTGEPALAEAARRHLDGEADPAGAAAIAAVTAMGSGGPNRQDRVHRAFADAWITEHGLAFAACALVELSRTGATRKGGGGWRGTWVGAVRTLDESVGVSLEEARRVRGLLAAASESDYAEAVARLAGHRSGWGARWLVSYLVPAREDWVDECCAAAGPQSRRHDLSPLVLSALGKADQLAAPFPARGLLWGQATRALLATMVDGIGPDALPFLLGQADTGNLESDDRKRIYETVAVLPTDEAFQALLDRLDRKHVRAALGEAARRFPVRALRLLARAGAHEMLANHVEANPELVAAVLPGLPDDVAAAVERVAAASTRAPAAAPEDLPAVLTDPPWLRPRRPIVGGLDVPEPRLAWRDGERQAWLDVDPKTAAPDSTDWEMLVEGYKTGTHKTGPVSLLVYGPEELIRPLLRGFRGYGRQYRHPWLPSLVARYGMDALPVAVGASKAFLESASEPLMPYLDAGVAMLMAEWLSKGGKFGAPAREWFDRHGTDAVPLLVPAALGAKDGERRYAETALRHLQGAHGLDGVVAAGRAHGDEPATAVAELLSMSPAWSGLDRPAKAGGWVELAALPQVLLRGGERALPLDATGHLIDLLTLTTPHEMDELRRVCEPDTIAGFGWALFQQWLDAGKPAKDAWALRQLGRTGDDETVRRLTPVMRAWPGEGGHKNAVNGLGVLAEIGSDVALMHLHGIAQKVKFKGLQAEAQERIRQVAERLGLTTGQLADRLVPDFGLDAEGGMVLDYGPRRFTVRFDEQLKPFVADEDGKQRKALPKPGAKDDQALAPAAYKTFAGLKKDVRTVAADQLRRLEQAMVTQRRWTSAEFGEFIVRHPLVWHIARRLVWLSEDGDKATAFRIAEDRTLADAADDAFTLPESARVGIAHPLQLDVDAWSEVFADYEIVQPFAQLARPVHALTEDERSSGRLERFEKLEVPFGKVLGLVKLGWERGAPQDAGGERWISRRVADGRHVVIDLDPGISVGAVDATGDHQVLDYVWFATEPGDFRPRKGTPLTFGELDDVMASEILADLTTLEEAAEK
ncbi:DUF4132 domain-containing protein [Actinomadura darangshiensis]|uniref:DUF4132 domain-containing protein n=1 Tax=Actinomadura darangshiensis TaxID=705336 RepID=A0A4R5A5Y7_9ACTN|nr:DUF4132 domain-containing protein [Actinomadura darangshiensis]TDD66480.1 DUF4132 domain-containing protein [Actinomadura darangshiensis]